MSSETTITIGEADIELRCVYYIEPADPSVGIDEGFYLEEVWLGDASILDLLSDKVVDDIRERVYNMLTSPMDDEPDCDTPFLTEDDYWMNYVYDPDGDN